MAQKSVLITGCSAAGMGHAIALSFQKRGYTVFATARSTKKMEDLASLDNVHLIALDVTSPPAIAAAVEEVASKTEGKLDVLVNNAGTTFIMPTLDVDIDAAKDHFEVNYWAPLRMIQKFSSMLIAARGCVVNIASISAHITLPFQSQYNASKSAFTSLSETLRLELAPLGVRVVTVMAGGVNTKIFDNCPGPESLPPTSPYVSVEKYLAEKPEWEEMAPETFAERVVNDVVSGAKGKIWHGDSSATVRYAGPILPQFIIDRLMVDRGRGLQHMTKR